MEDALVSQLPGKRLDPAGKRQEMEQTLCSRIILPSHEEARELQYLYPKSLESVLDCCPGRSAIYPCLQPAANERSSLPRLRGWQKALRLTGADTGRWKWPSRDPGIFPRDMGGAQQCPLQSTRPHWELPCYAYGRLYVPWVLEIFCGVQNNPFETLLITQVSQEKLRKRKKQLTLIFLMTLNHHFQPSTFNIQIKHSRGCMI